MRGYKCSIFVVDHQVTDEPLHTLKVHESGILVATGCEGGNVALMELTEGLASANRNDKTAVTAMFERETRREKILEVRTTRQSDSACS